MGKVKYEVVGNSVRRQALLCLRPFLTETLIDVIPVLGQLRRFLEEFAMSEGLASNITSGSGPSSAAAAVAQLCYVEDVAQIHDSILHRLVQCIVTLLFRCFIKCLPFYRYKGKWKKKAEEFLSRIQSQEGFESAQRAASRWADVFSEENVGALLGVHTNGVGTNAVAGDAETFEHPLLRAPRCVVCGELATKRCSRCKHEWYCRRQCQVEHWPRHKKACDIMMSVNSS